MSELTGLQKKIAYYIFIEANGNFVDHVDKASCVSRRFKITETQALYELAEISRKRGKRFNEVVRSWC
jgi:hypothetical protein